LAVLLILVLSCLIFRGLGFAGVPAFATWQVAARDGLFHRRLRNRGSGRTSPPRIAPCRCLRIDRIFLGRLACQHSRGARGHNTSRQACHKLVGPDPDADSLHRHSFLVRPLKGKPPTMTPRENTSSPVVEAGYSRAFSWNPGAGLKAATKGRNPARKLLAMRNPNQ